MPKRYAKGKHAVAECARSGRKMLLKDTVSDGYYPSLVVDPDWFEAKHPQESLPEIEDPVALWRPAPERDQVNAVVNVFGGGNNDPLGGDGVGGLSYGFEIGSPSIKVVADPPPLIFLRSSGAIYDSVADGINAFTLDLPAGRQVGDLLIVSSTRSSATVDPVESSNWNFTLGDNPSSTYSRVATGDSDDNYTVPGNVGDATVVAQMCAIGNNSGQSLSAFQASASPLGGETWPVNSMTVGSVANNTTVILVCSRATINQTPSPPIEVANAEPSGMEVMGEIGTNNASAGRTLYQGLYFQFQETSVAMAAFDQGYIPLDGSGIIAISNRYLRFQLT